MGPLAWVFVAVGVGVAGAVARGRAKRAAGERKAAAARRMRVQFRLFDDGEAVAEDTLTLTDASQSQTYHAKTGDTSRAYTVTYAFGRPSSISVKGPTWEGAVAIGVHESAKQEEIALGVSALLVYECTPLT